MDTDRRGLRVMGLDECLERLGSAVIGRVAFVHDGEPVVLPVTFGLDGATVVFRTSWGAKLQAAGQVGPVVLEADEVDRDEGTGWSVVVKGTAAVEYEAGPTERWEQLGVPYWLDPADETFWVRITAEEVSGRELLPR
jgi:nitroimidazol reductase NimA-like FMN-containing flavoprotein (pyridoxamine 5'-phosphate oxidase superfamily)